MPGATTATALSATTEKLPDAPALDGSEAVIAATKGWARAALARGVYAGLRSGESRALSLHVTNRSVHAFRPDLVKAVPGVFGASPPGAAWERREDERPPPSRSSGKQAARAAIGRGGGI